MKIKELYLSTLKKLRESFRKIKIEIAKDYKDTKKEVDKKYKESLIEDENNDFELRENFKMNVKIALKSEISFLVKVFSIIFLLSIITDFIFQKNNFVDFFVLRNKDYLFFYFNSNFITSVGILLLFVLLIYGIITFWSFLKRLWRTNSIRIFNTILIFSLLFGIIFGFSGILIIMISGIIVSGIIQLCLNEYKHNYRQEIIGLLLADKKIENPNDDVFWKENKRYEKFYELIKNNGSRENQVFGLVAEWGAGKSSFLHLLRKTSKKEDKVIFVNFNPWYYEGQKELLEKLFDEITATLRNNSYYIGDISRRFAKFANMLEENSSGIFGMKIPFVSMFFGETSLQEHKDKINNLLSKIDKKLVIIIDDLDRVTSDKFIEILKIVDLTRDFYNTSFVLCYDPQNFNSVDTTFIQTQRTKEQKIEHVDSQRIDNSELIRYMGKIVTTFFELETPLIFIKQEFIKIFTDNKKISFSDESIKGILKGIDRLFEYSVFSKWGKFYSDLRGIKRLFNNFILIQLIIDTSFYDLFDDSDNNRGLYFDIFIKNNILKLYHPNIYKSISQEQNITNSFGEIYNLNLTNLGLNPKKEKPEYSEFLRTLCNDEVKLIGDLLPTLNENQNIFDDELKRRKSIRDYGELGRYFMLSNVATDSTYFRRVIDTTKNILKRNFERFYDFYSKYGIKGFDDILQRIPVELQNIKDSKEKIELTFDIIYEIIYRKELYKFYDNNFSFYIDIPKILDSSVRTNQNIDISHISEFVYGNENEKALPIKIFENGKSYGAEEEIKGLVEGLRLLLAADTTRGGSFYNFERAVKTEKLYDIIYPYFEEHYIKAEKNFIEYIYKFEEKYNQKILGHLLYMLFNYAPDDKKKSLTEYFIEGFKIKQEYYFRWILRHIDDSFDREPVIRIGEVVKEYFDSEIFIKYIQENYDNFVKWMQTKSEEQISVPSKYVGHSEMNFFYKDILEMYVKGYEYYLSQNQK